MGVPVYEFEGDSVTRKWIHYWEDTDSGEFYWKDSEPKKQEPDTPTFKDKVEEKIREKMADGTIEYGDIKKHDDEAKKALVSITMPDGTEAKGIVTDDNGTLNFKKL